MAFGSFKPLVRQLNLLLWVGSLMGYCCPVNVAVVTAAELEAAAGAGDVSGAASMDSLPVYAPSVEYPGPFEFDACWRSSGLVLELGQGDCEIDGYRGISGNYLNFLISGVSTLLDDDPKTPALSEGLSETPNSPFRSSRGHSQAAIQQWLCEWLRSQWANAKLPLIQACLIEFLETEGANNHELVVENISLIGRDFTMELAIANGASADDGEVRYHHAVRSIQIIYRRELDESEGIFAD
ncbi:hypothetical protein [uncultured Umboniibacter sp.]|uniref:hypothetical protein n=1 Tax=uncultured Umboniibacter sp. TaxID=1798917 RepID=UPI002609E0D1|nr:hypothetical protein [uncultured Umboniibacter sp.]